MPRLQHNLSAKIADTLSDLIALTRTAKLDFTTQLLQMARLDVLMNQQDVTQEELDALRAALEGRTSVIKMTDFELLRRKHAARD